MAIRIVRLGSTRQLNEGVRLGTVRRPPRGVPKSEFAARDYYDVWLPNLAPSSDLMKTARQAVDAKSWSLFTKQFKAEMTASGADKVLDVLAALSHQTNFSLGCYCEEESRCHRSVLRELLVARGAALAE